MILRIYWRDSRGEQVYRISGFGDWQCTYTAILTDTMETLAFCSKDIHWFRVYVDGTSMPMQFFTLEIVT